MNWFKNKCKAWFGVACLGLAGCAGPGAREPAAAAAAGSGCLHGRARALGGVLVLDAILRPVAPVRAGGARALPSDGLPPKPPTPGGASAGLPPTRQTLGLILLNAGRGELAVEVREVRGVLGNFAPRPARVLLAPGQTCELQGMPSAYAATLVELAVAVRLRADGRDEEVVLTLRAVDYPPPLPSAADGRRLEE